MKQNCYMAYALDDCERALAKRLPTTASEDFLREAGLATTPQSLAAAEKLFSKLREEQGVSHKIMRKALLFERQQYHICQAKGMEYLKLYTGNSQFSDATTKRMTYWDKIQNTKDNQAKQADNKAKSANNAKSANFCKNRNQNNSAPQSSGQQNGGSSGGGSGGYQGKKPWVQPWANQSNDTPKTFNSGGGGNGNAYNKSFTSKTCPKCLKAHHGNSPCE
jgi:hypothetical protein